MKRTIRSLTRLNPTKLLTTVLVYMCNKPKGTCSHTVIVTPMCTTNKRIYPRLNVHITFPDIDLDVMWINEGRYVRLDWVCH